MPKAKELSCMMLAKCANRFAKFIRNSPNMALNWPWALSNDRMSRNEFSHLAHSNSVIRTPDAAASSRNLQTYMFSPCLSLMKLTHINQTHAHLLNLFAEFLTYVESGKLNSKKNKMIRPWANIVDRSISLLQMYRSAVPYVKYAWLINCMRSLSLSLPLSDFLRPRHREIEHLNETKRIYN